MIHAGGCHCGKVRFEVEMDLKKAMACDCSICTKRGSLLAFAPAANFKVLSGEEDLKIYMFNKKVIEHKFCTTCGILPFGLGAAPDGTKMAAINVRCLDGFTMDQVTIFNHKHSHDD